METVTIGGDVYEFDDDSDVAPGHIAVDISGGATSVDASLALVTAIMSSTTEPIHASDGVANVIVVANQPGLAGNDIAVSTDCANASWNNDTLVDGQYAVLARKGDFYLDGDAGDLFFAFSDITNPTQQGGWKLFLFE